MLPPPSGSTPSVDGPEHGRPAPRPRVLVADNDESVTSILRVFLERQGLEVRIAEDGQSALSMLEQECYDVFVCDLDMPLLGGDEILDRVRHWADAPPVLVISGYVDDLVEAGLLAHPSVRQVFRKPFDLKAFARSAAQVAGAGDQDGGAPPPGTEGRLF